MASVASELTEKVTAHAQSDSVEDAREICADCSYFLNNPRIIYRKSTAIDGISYSSMFILALAIHEPALNTAMALCQKFWTPLACMNLVFVMPVQVLNILRHVLASSGFFLAPNCSCL